MHKVLWISLIVTILDQFTKYLIFSQMQVDSQTIEVLPIFNIVYTHNPGVSFGFLSNAGPWKWYAMVGITLFLSIVLLVWILRMKPWEKLQAIGMSMILGGAVGNLIDRFLHTDELANKSGVVDFLSFHWGVHTFPAFNVADSAISIGVAIIIVFMIFVPDPKDLSESETSRES